MNLIFAPFIVIYLLLLYFFRYFEEYHKNPGALGSRQYKPFAQWKFREFNELYHIFKKRIDFSHKFASKYIDQFPKEKTAQLSRFNSPLLFPLYVINSQFCGFYFRLICGGVVPYLAGGSGIVSWIRNHQRSHSIILSGSVWHDPCNQ